jgi:hypothetical protein
MLMHAITAASSVGGSSSDRVVFALDPSRPEWMRQGFSEDEAIDWRRHGFTPSAANQWRGYVFRTAEEAAPWYEMDVPLTIAKAFKSHDMEPQQAALWFPNPDITPHSRVTYQQSLRIMSWVLAAVPYDNWVYACVMNDIAYEDWVAVGGGENGERLPTEEIASAVAYQWSISGFSESIKTSFRTEGITSASEARQWASAFRGAGFSANPKTIAGWRKRNFGASDTVEWRRAIELTFPHLRNENVASLAAKWREAGYSAFEMYLFSSFSHNAWYPPPRDAETTMKEFREAQTSGVEDVFRSMYEAGIPEPQLWDVEEVRAAKDEIDTGTYLTVQEISEWVQHGFSSPESIAFWKEQGLSPAEASDEYSKIC